MVAANVAREKKVLMVTPAAPWGLFGGTARVSRILLDLLSEYIDLQVCCLRGNARAVPGIEHGAIVLSGEVRAFKRRAKGLFDYRAESVAHRQFERAKVVRGFKDLLAKQRPQFVIFDHIYSSWLVDAIQDPAIKVAYIAHDDMVAYADSLMSLGPRPLRKLRFGWLRAQYRIVQQKMLRRCDFLLTLTVADQELLEQDFDRGPTEVVPLYFALPPCTREYGRPFDNVLITGSFDTWEKQMGLTVFLETVVRGLVQTFPDLRLVIAGRVPRSYERELARPHITVVNSPSEGEMADVFGRASAGVVLDLQASGLKIKTIELAGAGLPLVSWPPGTEGTKLIHEKSCLVARSASEFRAQLACLVSNASMRREIGMEARAVIEANFSRDTASRRLKGLKLLDAIADAGALRSAGE